MKKLIFLFFAFVLADSTHAQYTKIFDFDYSTNGAYPRGSLFSDGTYMYGMTYDGGVNIRGVIFKIKISDNSYTKMLDFDGTNKGMRPSGGLVSDGTFLYGLTELGGANNKGVVFKIKISDNSYTKILDFDGSNGQNPLGSLISDGSYLYGMTYGGGSNGNGVIFKIKISDNSYTKLLDLDNSLGNGYNPYGSLFSDGTFLYGMTSGGGANNYGTIFKIKISDNSFTKLIDFNGTLGRTPRGSLISDGTYLYGCTQWGGANNIGVVFKLKIADNTYSKIMDFDGSSNGSQPMGSLLSDGISLYGTTSGGGSNNFGVLFKIKISDNSCTKLIDFLGTSNGKYPYFTSVISNGLFLFGMTGEGGANNKGVVFKYLLPPTPQSSSISFSSITENSASITWTNGSGANNAVFIKNIGSGNAIPVDNTNYTGGDYGSGTQIGATGWYCVYSGSANNCVISGLSQNTTYSVSICAYNYYDPDGAGGVAPAIAYNNTTATNNPNTFTTLQSQTITFGALAAKTYGDADFAGGATASSGLTVTYTTSNGAVATVVSGQIHIVGAGTCTVYADQAGNGTYAAAPQQSQILTVYPVGTTWDGSAWDNGTPNSFVNATIAGNYTGAGFECKNLTVNNSVTLTINANQCINAAQTLSNNGNIVVKSGGGLLENGITNNGSMSAELPLTAGRWHLFGTPLAASFDVGTKFFGDWFYTYDESQITQNAAWFPVVNIYTPVTNDKGYLIKAANTSTKTFTGTFKTGNHSFPTLPLSYEGYSLVANPYPSVIDWNGNGWTKTNINNTVWVWNNTVYATFDGSVGVNGGTRYIAPLQGFFVQANVAGASVDITNASRTCESCNFLKGGSVPQVSNLLKMSTIGNNLSDEIAIYQADVQNTSYKMKASGDVPQISFRQDIQDVQDFSILKYASLNGKTIPVSFECAKSGTYSINAVLQNFETNLPVYLHDKKMNVYTDLRDVTSYQFAYTAGESVNRFELLYSSLTSQKLKVKSEELKVYSYSKTVFVEIPSARGTLQIFDVAGKLEVEKQINAVRMEISLKNAGVYLVKVNGKVAKINVE